jgi:hypothetical protein
MDNKQSKNVFAKKMMKEKRARGRPRQRWRDRVEKN